jgi:hypothetical protein
MGRLRRREGGRREGKVAAWPSPRWRGDAEPAGKARSQHGPRTARARRAMPEGYRPARPAIRYSVPGTTRLLPIADRQLSTRCGHSGVVQYRTMSALILPFSLILYIVLPAWMLRRGWLIRAGIAMILTALLPWVVWHLQIQRPWGPGSGIALMVTAAMILAALVPIGLGVARTITRSARASQKRGA